jgi:hypothetical protein
VLSDVQNLLVTALQTPDPAGFLKAHVAESRWRLDDQERAWLQALDDAGLRITRVLVRKLRLQRLTGGDPDAARLCAADPAAFAERFRAYEAAVPPTAVFPAEEAAAWRLWLAARGL